MRVLISGGAGFVGSHLADRLLAQGCAVVAVDNLLTGRQANIRHNLSNPKFQFMEADVCVPLQVSGEVQAILHFASPASPIDYLKHPLETLHVGSLGTENLLRLARRKGARFLLASTSEVYGDPLEHPQPESYFGNVNPIGPRAVYDEAKRYAEAVTMAYYREFRVDTRIVRIFNTYGVRMRADDGRVVSNFIVQALKGESLTVYGEGGQTRSFCYVSDLVAGILRLLWLDGDDNDRHLPVNLGNPLEFTVKQLAERVVEMTGSRSQVVYLPLPEDDPKLRQPVIERARTLLDWQPVVTLEEGLRLTIAYFKNELEEESSYIVAFGESRESRESGECS